MALLGTCRVQIAYMWILILFLCMYTQMRALEVVGERGLYAGLVRTCKRIDFYYLCSYCCLFLCRVYVESTLFVCALLLLCTLIDLNGTCMFSFY